MGMFDYLYFKCASCGKIAAERKQKNKLDIKYELMKDKEII